MRIRYKNYQPSAKSRQTIGAVVTSCLKFEERQTGLKAESWRLIAQKPSAKSRQTIGAVVTSCLKFEERQTGLEAESWRL
ncbi:MAG TPA: hypothetical protein VEC12_12780, partial [Bacteroidia bacterium]|nr:hypothetical protein [Bacteroidia bacterium]